MFRRRDTALQNRSSRLVASILSQLERIRAGESVEERHKDFLKKKLARTANLMAFDEALELTGLIVTKLDGTAKGGVVCAIAREKPVPVYFVGVGEKLEDLQTFNAREFAQALLG